MTFLTDKKKAVPASHKDRPKLSKKEFGAKYYSEDKRLEKIAIELIDHLENMLKLDLSGLRPDDPICDIFEQPKKRDLESETIDSRWKLVKKSLDIYIEYRPFEKFLKGSTWDPETIRSRSFDGVIREIAKVRDNKKK